MFRSRTGEPQPDDDGVSDMTASAAGKWFLLLLEHGANDPRTERALAHARRLGADEAAIEWASNTGVHIATEIAREDA